MANTISSGDYKEYATVDTAPGSGGFWTNPIGLRGKSLSIVYFSLRGTGTATVTLQFKCEGDADWTDYYNDGNAFNVGDRNIVAGNAGFVSLDNSYPFHDNEIYNNFITAPLIDYARGLFSYFDTNGYDNSIYNNVVYNITVQNQLTGNGLKFYNNIIDSVKGCPYPEKAGVGNGIALEPYPVPTTNMEIYDNVITNCKNAGIRVFSQTGDTSLISGNLFQNNNTWDNDDTYNYQISYFNNPNVTANSFIDNHIYKAVTNMIHYRGAQINVPSFNGYNGTNDDVITGNDAILKFGNYTTTVEDLRIEHNATASNKEVSLSVPMIDKDGTKYLNSVTLQPYTSIILMVDANPAPPILYPNYQRSNNGNWQRSSNRKWQK